MALAESGKKGLRKMKIGFIAEHYPPTEGGIATSAQRVARELVRLGLSVRVICFDHSRPITSHDYVIEQYDEGVQVARVGPFFLKQPRLPVDHVPEKTKASLRRRMFEQMVSLLRPQKVELILSFYLINAGYLGTFASRELNLPLIAGVRGNDIGRNIFNVERFAVVQWIVEGAHHVACVNEYLRRRVLLAFPRVADRISVIPNSVQLSHVIIPVAEARARVAKATGWDGSELRLVFIGTLREKKGAAVLATALLSMGSRSAIRLLVVGPDLGHVEMAQCGDAWMQLKAQGRVFVTGRVPRDAVASWAAGCDVVVMPSLDDGMANGLLEGMALGLCPLATTVFADIVRSGENGVLVPPGEPDALACAMSQLAQDRERIKRGGAAARRTVEKWTPAQEAGAYLELFRRVLQRNG